MPFEFGISKVRCSPVDSERADNIARDEGAALIEANLPEGYQRWFRAPNRGDPFDRALRKRVLDRCADENLLTVYEVDRVQYGSREALIAGERTRKPRTQKYVSAIVTKANGDTETRNITIRK